MGVGQVRVTLSSGGEARGSVTVEVRLEREKVA
jgi:hypothetical protein